MSATAEHLLTLQEDNLPPGWTLATIEDLVGKGGVFIDGDWVESKDQDPEGDVRLIQLADVGDGEYRNKSARFLTYERAIQLGCTFLQKGDVLIARMPDPLGRACIFPGDTKPAVTVVDVAVVRSAAGEFNHRWLMYFVNAPAFRAVVASMQSGSTRKRISRGNLAKIALPVPPLDQQKHIVAEIEKQFSRLDEAVANLKRVKANLKRYKAAVLKAAVEGRLVETEAELARREGRSYETGAQLLQRILETRRSQWKGKGKYKEPAAPDTTDLPELPEGWVWATVESLSMKVADGVHKKPNYIPEGIPFVTVRNLTAGNGISFTDLNYVSPKDHEEFCKRTHPERGDILISKDGTLGVVRLIETDRPFSVFVSVALVKPVMYSQSRYLVTALESPTVQRQMVPKGSGLQHIHLEDLRADCIPIPPHAEQERIVAEVDRRLSLIRETEAQIDANRMRSDRLRHSILESAFAGRLTRITQDLGRPEANVLLAGIVQ
jgi:type I restriction enzyme S subunit